MTDNQQWAATVLAEVEQYADVRERQRILTAALERVLDHSNRLAFQAGWNHATAEWEQRAAATAEEARADELLWAATEAECHEDLVMLKRRAAAATKESA